MPLRPLPAHLSRRLLGALSAAPAVLRGARRIAGDKPNLLFLWTDEQRADTLAACGNRRLHVPVLNRLAAESVVFARCDDAQPVCTPARSTLLTGQWPHANGCNTNNIALRAVMPCLPELLGDFAVRRKPEHCKPAFLVQGASRFIRRNSADPWLLHGNFLEPHMPFFGPYNDLHSAEEAPVRANCQGDRVAREPGRCRRTRLRSWPGRLRARISKRGRAGSG